MVHRQRWEWTDPTWPRPRCRPWPGMSFLPLRRQRRVIFLRRRRRWPRKSETVRWAPARTAWSGLGGWAAVP